MNFSALTSSICTLANTHTHASALSQTISPHCVFLDTASGRGTHASAFYTYIRHSTVKMFKLGESCMHWRNIWKKRRMIRVECTLICFVIGKAANNFLWPDEACRISNWLESWEMGDLKKNKQAYQATRIDENQRLLCCNATLGYTNR